MTWELALNLDMDKYSALVGVGGDGTYHEVTNGMLHRADKRRLPLAFIPNGSGNDTLRPLGVTNLAKSLDYIIKGDLLKVDLTRCLIDADTEDEIPEDEKFKRLRYVLLNTCIGLPSRVNYEARHFKWCCCNAYQIAAVKEIMNLKYERVDIYQGEKLVVEDLETCFLMSMNGKACGNNMLINPMGVINDGQIETCFVEGKKKAGQMIDMMDKSIKHGGIHAYDPTVMTLRGKNFKYVMKRGKMGDPKKDKHILAMDGENILFDNFIRLDAV